MALENSACARARAFKDLNEKTLAAITRHFFVLEKRRRGHTPRLPPIQAKSPHRPPRLRRGDIKEKSNHFGRRLPIQASRYLSHSGPLWRDSHMAKRRLIGDGDEASGGVDNVLPPRRPGLGRAREGGRQRSAKP